MTDSRKPSLAGMPPQVAVAGRTLVSRDIRTLFLASLSGGALEFYDFVVFVFFCALPLSHLFFPQDTAPWLAQLQVSGIIAAGYLARPLGGIVMAHFLAIGWGRKRMLHAQRVPDGAANAGHWPAAHLCDRSASAGAAAASVLMRVVQGVAIGGEVPGAWVFVAEPCAARSRVGFACACLTAGLTVGILIGSLVTAAWINHHLLPDTKC